MASLRQLYVALNLRAETFNNGLRDSRRQVQEFQRTIQPTQRLLEEMAAGMKKAGMALTVGLTAPIAAVAGLGLQFNAMQEQAQIAFTTMLGDGKKARDFLGDLKDFAAKTPFEFPDLVRASQRLLAMGFAAEKVKPLLTSVGDAAAGLGGSAELIDRVTLALGQMQGRGRIATQEMNQLTEAGIPAWKMLAAGMGVAESKIRDMVEKGLVPAGPAIDILQRGMDKAFGGLMAKQAETFSGLLSTIKDDARFIAGDLTTGLFDLIKGPLKTMVTTLEGLRGTIAGLSSETKGWLAIFGGGLAAIGPVLLGTSFAINSIVSAWASAKTAMVGISAALAAIKVEGSAAAVAFTAFTSVLAVAAVAAATFAIIKMVEALIDLNQALKDLDKARAQESTSLERAEADLRKYGIVIETQNKTMREREAAVAKYGQSLKEIINLEGAARDAAIKALAPRVAATQEIARITQQLAEVNNKIAELSNPSLSQKLMSGGMSGFQGSAAALRGLNEQAVILQQSLNLAEAAAKKLEPAVKAVAAAPVKAAVAELSKELESLGKHFTDALRPADALNAEMLKLKQTFGVSNSDLVAVYWEQILKSSEAQREHGIATTGLVAQMEPLAYALDYNAKKYKELQKEAEEAAKKEEEAAKQKQEQIVRTAEEYWKVLRPADALNERLQAYVAIGANAITMAQLYGKEIIAAADAQRQNGETVTGLSMKLYDLAKHFEFLSTAEQRSREDTELWAKVMASTTHDIDKFRTAMEKIKIPDAPFRFPDIPPAPPEARFNQTAQAGIDKIRKSREAADALEKAVRQLTAAGLTDAEMIFSLGSELSTAATAAKEFGFQLDPPTKRLIDLTEQTKKSANQAEQWQKTWEQVMANIVIDFSRGIADVIFKAKSLTSALAGIGKSAGRAFIEAFFAELFNPLTQLLSSWGKQLAGTLQSTVLPKIAGAIGLGSIFPKAAGAAATAGGAGGGAAGGAGGAGGAGLGISGGTLGFAGLAGLAAFGGFKLGGWLNDTFFGGAQKKAHKQFVEGIQNPFYAGLGQELQQFRSQRDAGTLTAATGQAFLQDITGLIRGFTTSALDFANQGKKQGAEVQKALDTMKGLYGDSFRKVFDEVNSAIAKVKPPIGSGIPQTGLALSASTLFSDAVDRLVPALDKLTSAPRGTQVTATFAPVITVSVTGDAAATDDVRRKVVPEITSILTTGLDGVREEWTKIFRDSAGIVTA